MNETWIKEKIMVQYAHKSRQFANEEILSGEHAQRRKILGSF